MHTYTAPVENQFDFISTIERRHTNETVSTLTLQAEAGDAEAQFKLADIYENGAPGIPDDEQRAWNLYRMAADNGHIFAMASLLFLNADALDHGRNHVPPMEGIDTELAAAETLATLKSLADQGNKKAFYFLGIFAMSGIAENPGQEHALNYFLEGANLGHSDSMTILGAALTQCENTELSPLTGVEWLERSWCKRSSYAGLHLGRYYIETYSDECNPEKGYRYLQEAAELGSANAAYYAGKCKATGTGTYESDKEAIQWFLMAAEAGDKEALYALSYSDHFAEIEGFTKEQRHTWLKESAELGYARAMGIFGWHLAYGNEMDQNVDDGVDYILRAAMQDDGYSQYLLGTIYMDGDLLPENQELAVKWYLDALNNGCTKGHAAYGDALLWGYGVDQDLNAAEYHFVEALKHRHYAAAIGLGHVSLVLRHDQPKALGFFFFGIEKLGPPPEDLRTFIEKLENEMNGKELRAAQEYADHLCKKLSD